MLLRHFPFFLVFVLVQKKLAYISHCCSSINFDFELKLQLKENLELSKKVTLNN